MKIDWECERIGLDGKNGVITKNYKSLVNQQSVTLVGTINCFVFVNNLE